MIQGTEILMNGLLYTVKISPYFKFWYALLELKCLMFVRSLISGNFEIFVEVLDQFLMWMFSLNQTHYGGFPFTFRP